MQVSFIIVFEHSGVVLYQWLIHLGPFISQNVKSNLFLSLKIMIDIQ